MIPNFYNNDNNDNLYKMYLEGNNYIDNYPNLDCLKSEVIFVLDRG